MAIRGGYVMAMKSVNVAELKNHLSHYLRLVRRGQPILVRDRDRVIARIEPAGGSGVEADDDAGRLADLEARASSGEGMARSAGSCWRDARRSRQTLSAHCCAIVRKGCEVLGQLGVGAAGRAPAVIRRGRALDR
jgi:antitoxin (DNA-binding transcriptional repressor) of toxin-antitoxin stability system